METDLLCNFLLRHHLLSPALDNARVREKLCAYAAGVLAMSQYPQKQLLLSAGQPAEHLYFVQEGFARGYFLEERSQRQVTVHLWAAGSVMAAVSSFFLQQPSDLYLEVMPNTVLLSLSRTQLEELMVLFPEAAGLPLRLTLHFKAFYKRRMTEQLTRTAWERYENLLVAYPRIEQKVTKDVMASYLGVTPQSLSRLLKENRYR